MLKHLIVLCGVFAVFYFLCRGTAWQGPYGYDEADYMYAASLGFSANWMDSPTLSLPEFLRAGLSSRASSERTDLSEMIRNKNDVLFYRHWHGPLYTYWLRTLRVLALDERSTRAAGIVFPAVVGILLSFGGLWLMPGAAGEIAAVTAPVLYLWSYPVARTSELAPHQLFALGAVAALLLLAKSLQVTSRGRFYWYGACLATGFTFCVLEVAFVLILTLLICCYAGRTLLKPNLAFAGKSIAAFLAPVLIIWPAAIFKLSYVKAVLFMTYLAAFRKDAWATDIGIGRTWWLRFVSSPVPWLLFAIAAGYLIKNRLKATAWIPFAVFSLLMSLAILPVNTELPRYTLTVLPGVVLLAAAASGLLAARSGPSLRLAMVTLIGTGMFVTSWPKVRARMPMPNKSAEAMLALVRDHDVSQKTLLVPHGDSPMLHYYFPEVRFRAYYDEAAIAREVRSGAVDGVIYRDPVRLVFRCGTPPAEKDCFGATCP